ncbi:hypothetical protein [Streptomyces sp. PTD5-9]|uniref:hypothetical protein n=1 Tax=Streptomyces sp. PTD5-9 TaxID=3120150 RepID=UPI00300A2465
MSRTVVHGGPGITAFHEIHAEVLVGGGRARREGRGATPALAGGGPVGSRREGNSGK